MRPSDDGGYELEDDGGRDWRGAGGRHAPPTMAGEVMVEYGRSSSWPTVFGVIGIVVSGWGLLSSGCGLLMMAGLAGAMGLGQQMSQQLQTAGVTGVALAVGVAKSVLIMALAVYLLVACIGLLRRARSGAEHLTRWAWLRIAAFVVTTILELVTTNYGHLQQQAGQNSMAFIGGFMVIGVLLALVFALWFPVLVLIWFRREVIRDEVAGWW